MAPVVSLVYPQHPMWVLVLQGSAPALAPGGWRPQVTLLHLSSSSCLPLGVSQETLPGGHLLLLVQESHMHFLAQGAGRLGMPPLGPPSGVAATIGALAFGRFCPAGSLAQSLYILLQKVGRL